jgi:hypothetical protein
MLHPRLRRLLVLVVKSTIALSTHWRTNSVDSTMPQGRFLFVDFEGLLASVHEHVRLQPSVFGTDYPRHLSPLEASKVTKLLSGQDAAVICQHGVHRGKLNAEDAHLLLTAGWKIRRRRTLEDLLKQNLSDVGACEGKKTRTLVLCLGILRRSLLKVLDSNFDANWRVQIFCLRRSNMEAIDRLRGAHPTKFQNSYMDRLMKGLLRPTSTAPSNQEENRHPESTRRGDECGRFVLMDLDNISETLFKSTSLLQRAPRASSAVDLRIDFHKLTRQVCGATPSKVRRQVATYCNTHALFVQGLMSLQWTAKKQSKVTTLQFHLQYLTQLLASETANDPKTLVLVRGDDAFDTIGKASFTGILQALIARGWRIEVHSWLESLGTVFLNLEKEYSDRVVVKPLDNVFHDLIYVKCSRSSPQQHRSKCAAPTTVPRALNDSNLVGPELSRLQQQMQEVARALAELRASNSVQTTNQLVEMEQRLLLQQQEFACQLRQQEEMFSTESERLIQRAREARQYHRLALQGREEMLTCPITHCLYESPVMTACCGKTFSKAAVDRLQARRMACPWCRRTDFTASPNRDVAQLVDQYTAELSALESLE